MTEKEALQKMIKDSKQVIAEAEADLKNLEVTYSIGDRFVDEDGVKCMLTYQTKGMNQVGMTDLSNGCLDCGSHEVRINRKITQKELDTLTKINFTRYWDIQKQILDKEIRDGKS